MFGGIGVKEILLLLFLGLLLFGAKKLPGLSRSAGKGLREFKGSVAEFKQPVDEVKDLVGIDGVKDLAPLANPKTALAKILMEGDDDPKKPSAGPTGTDT